MRGHDARILLPGMDSLFKRVLPVLVCIVGDQQHDRGAEPASCEAVHLFKRFRAAQDIDALGLEVLRGRRDVSRLKDGGKLFGFDRSVRELPDGIPLRGEFHEFHCLLLSFMRQVPS